MLAQIYPESASDLHNSVPETAIVIRTGRRDSHRRTYTFLVLPNLIVILTRLSHYKIWQDQEGVGSPAIGNPSKKQSEM